MNEFKGTPGPWVFSETNIGLPHREDAYGLYTESEGYSLVYGIAIGLILMWSLVLWSLSRAQPPDSWQDDDRIDPL